MLHLKLEPKLAHKERTHHCGSIAEFIADPVHHAAHPLTAGAIGCQERVSLANRALLYAKARTQKPERW